MSTSINSVSYGVDGFGLGLFPIGTNFGYSKYFKPVDTLTHDMQFYVQMDFSVGSPWLSGFDYKSGKPWWSDGDTYNTIDRGYFRLSSQLYTFLQQGLGVNPVEGSGPMVYLRLAWNSRFVKNAESLSLSSGGPNGAIFNQAPFSTDEYIQAYPWLTVGEGQNWNNHVALSSYWYFRRHTGAPDTHDGIYIDLTLEAGPKWLGNTVLPGVVTSDYYKASLYAEEYLTIFHVQQDNGWNWLTLMMGHSNSLGYLIGDVSPEHKIQADRLRGYLTDYLYLKFVGPQFIATDCYPYVQLSLYNNLYFGGVQNDITGQIRGISYYSGVSFEFHLRLFGFIHVRYQAGYDFARGFSTASPSWWQNGEIGFYVSL